MKRAHILTEREIKRSHAARTAVYRDVSPFWRFAFYMFVFQAA